MKRNILSMIITLSLLIGTVGCNGILDDLSQNPNAGILESAYTDKAGCDRGIKGIYGYLSSARCLGIMGMGFSLFRGDEATSNSEYAVCGQYNSRYTSAFDDVQHPFMLLYTVAGQATQLLEEIPKAKFANETDRNALLGEAYFLRGFAHFFLELNWRNISPIRSVDQIGVNTGRPFEEPLAVWEFITSDFEKAKGLLPKKGYWIGENEGRAVAASAAGMLGRTYLYMSGIESVYGKGGVNRYSEAAKVLSEIVKGDYGTYSLVNYADNFDVVHENNDESIFEIQLKGDRSLPGNGSFNPGLTNSVMHNDPRGKIPPFTKSPSLAADLCGVVHDWVYDAFAGSKNSVGETDSRMFATLVFDDTNSDIKLPAGMARPTLTNGETWDVVVGNKTYFKVKGSYSNANAYKAGFRKQLDWAVDGGTSDPGTPTPWFYNNRSHSPNWRYMRFADVYMMYAEAVLMGGSEANGLTVQEAIKRVRDRSGMPVLTTITMAELKTERILELSLEGHRFYDLLRWGELTERFDELERNDPNFKKFAPATYDGFVTGKHEWMPIPLDELSSNPYAKPNPGW